MAELLTIDPSINHCGWARRTGEKSELIYGTVNAPKEVRSSSDEFRLLWMVDALKNAVPFINGPPDYLNVTAIERPDLWGAYKSVASQHSGALQLLTLVVGALFHASSTWSDKVKLVRVSDWKGQLPKDISQERTEKYYGVKCRTDHEADALGLLRYLEEGERWKTLS